MENALIGGLVGSAFEKSRVPLEEDCLIHFDPPLRLLRGPLPSSGASSSFVLVFRDEQALSRALLDTEARVGDSLFLPWNQYILDFVASGKVGETHGEFGCY
ncbi:hypothetical protein EJ110_NYTH32083 [Nymphaea thermarum]|nr:hypothetical protein EJ110_NYTH32083 [Nymphaea thermarum]